MLETDFGFLLGRFCFKAYFPVGDEAAGGDTVLCCTFSHHSQASPAVHTSQSEKG